MTAPTIGYGTYRVRGRAGADAVTEAIDLGYRLIDSAVSYENEGAVGAAVRRRADLRDEIVVASKLPGRFYRYEQALQTVEESLLRSGLDVIDLYLLHWPNPHQDCYLEAWSALAEARVRGLVRAIGVCNFLPEHLERLVADSAVVPAVNQIEIHPWFPQEELIAVNARYGIATQAWSPLARGGEVLRDPVIARIADAHGASTGQVILSWHLHRGVSPLPKASTSERRRENLAAAQVALRADEVDRITALARADGRASGLDPAIYEEF